ncbi:CD99 antigen-like isoform X2 [Pyxicephalus adspersus]|uniref:CD99 antigen-like isoform X2 n=1 Tax=Pyxicephalus adspersus TaxID=30357 RepID=UPI003B5C3279
MTMRLPALFCLLFLITGIRGQEDFDLGDAVDDGDPTVAPTPKKEIIPTKKPADAPKPATSAPKSDPKTDDNKDFNLDDAVGGDEPPTKKPQPAQPGQGGGGGGGTFGDDDLFDAAGGVHPNDPKETDGKPGGEEQQGDGQEKQSVIAGILSALGVAAVGAVSSFIAYQKKKLCFKGQAEPDPENVNMDNQKGDQNDPQAQTNLLSK